MITPSLTDGGMSPQELETRASALTPVIERLQTIAEASAYVEPESSLALPSDEQIVSEALATIHSFDRTKLRYVVVVGIGGSNLGAKAIYDARYGSFDVLNLGRFPRLVFAETTSAAWLTHFAALAKTLTSVDEIVVCFISKSGTTTETVANYEVVAETLAQHVGDSASRTVAITDEGSQLWLAAETHGWQRASIPAPVGGRFSVFSAVGLVPLGLAGFDLAQLRAGAAEVRALAIGAPNNPVAQSAAFLAEQLAHGRSIHDYFVFNPELESFGKWYRQLMAESLGKKRDRTGAVVRTGFTPTVSIGSTDLHSAGQLYFEGPQDKITSFLIADSEQAVPIPPKRHAPELAPILAGRTVAEVQRAIYQGVTAAYRNDSMPFRELKLPDLSERSLGALLQWSMLEMMFLGELLNVNAFDQPGVEAYKKETKRVLEAATTSPR